ncbi:TldD/PmbA family protein [Piscinibacter sp.]|uniref:TldD/PmbA family protein n=1 Tax=Piscinibacter sp. TaxID=1903157 RepID=UPI002D0AEC3F|nr:TldD/PmbA family protein [Albitalea sp.]HUG24185.1 TldD/PmbA family protein [Albitalea sp.]
MDTTALQDHAERSLALMRAAGFEHAQVSANVTRLNELNVAHNEPSLLRSTESHKLSLLGLVDGRKASTDLSDLSEDSVRRRVASLFDDARSAPEDEANAVSSGQHTRLVQGPQQAEPALLADKLAELLAFRAGETPKMMIEEALAAHTLAQSHTLTSGGSDLACSLGWYSISVMGTARDGKSTSSFNFTSGSSNELRDRPAAEYFGIADMLRDTQQQVRTEALGGSFVGDVVLTPPAVADLMEWLQEQIGDVQLIAGSSLYRERVGTGIASPLLSLRSRFDAPGVAAISADGFVTPPVDLVRDGRLCTLTPSLYGSRKTGLPHVPLASAGWEVPAGQAPLGELVSAVARGALVGRLSMGNPASNGDFSGVIKNSFRIADGTVGAALSEVMITGNIARMLQDVAAVSRGRIDTGSWLLPWLRVTGLHFS